MLRTGVIGVGYLGRFHAQKYKALGEEGLCQFMGVYDHSYDRAKVVAEELSVKAYASVDELLKDVNAVAIASTTQTHFENAKKSLALGIHTNVEKPMTVTESEAAELLALAKQKNLVLAVGHSERFNPVFQYLKSKQTVPDFLEFRRHAPFKLRGSDVSVILDLMIHDLDLALDWLGALEVVNAYGAKIHSPSVDYAECELRSASGARIHISASRTAGVMTRAVRGVMGRRTFVGNLQTMEVEECLWSPGAETPVEKALETLPKQDHLMLETRGFLSAIQGGKDLYIKGEDGAAALRLAFEIEKKVLSS